MAKQLNVNLAFSADTSKVKAQLQDLQNQLNKLTLSSQTELGITKDIEEASRAAAELSVHLKNATNQQTGTLDFSKLNQSIKQSGTSLQQYGRTLQSLGPQGQQAFMSLAQAVANSEVPIRRTNAMLKEMGTTLANTVRWQLSSSMLHGFMGAVQSAYGYAQDLNESLNNIRIVTGQNIDQMAKFAEEANKAARALSTTTTEYTNASLIYYQQGLNDQQVKERTDITIKMANVSRQSAEVVSDQMTAVWNNFYDGSKSLEYYADVMTALGAATASSTDEISEGLNKFAAVADTVGLSYEYAASALATVTATTRQSADIVGTAFKTLFARIQDLELGKTLDDGTTLGSYSQALAKVGVQIKDTSGEMKSMDTILEEMAAKWDTLGKAEQVALAQSVAGVRQYTQLIALMNNWDFMKQNLATSNTASGALQKQADIYAESWEAARDRVTAAAESVYKALLNDDFFIDTLNSIEKIINFVDRLIDNLGGLKGVLTAIGAIVTKVFANQLSQGLTNIVYNVKMLTKAGREAEQANRKKVIDDAIESIPKSKEFSTKTEEAQQESMRSQLTLQQEMLANADKMNAYEQARNQMLLDRNKQLQEQAVLAAKAEDAAIQKRGKAIDTVQTRVAANFGGDQAFQLEVLRKITAETGKMKESFRVHNEIDSLFQAFQYGGQKGAEEVKKLQSQITSLKSGNPVVQSLINSMGDYDLTVENVEENITTLKTQIKALVTDSATSLKQTIIPEDQMDEGAAEIDNLVMSIEEQTDAEMRRKAAVQEGAQAHQSAAKAIHASIGAQKQWSDILVESANLAFSAASAFQMLSSAWDTIMDPNVSGWDKFLSIMMTLGMVIPTFISIYKTLKNVISLETIAKIANAAATMTQTAAEQSYGQVKGQNNTKIKQSTKETWKDTWNKLKNKGENIKDTWNQKAFEAQGNTIHKNGTSSIKGRSGFVSKAETSELTSQAGKQALKNLSTKIGGAAIIAASVAAAAMIAKAAIDYYNRFETAAKKAEETASAMKATYETVASAEQEFRSHIDTYSSGVEGLDKLTKGTEEYKEAVLQANNAAVELLNTYKNLKYEINDEGLIVIDEAGLAAAQRESLLRETRAAAASMQAQQDAKTAQLEADKINFQRTQMKAGGVHWDQDDTTAVAGGVGAGAALGVGATVAFANAWNPVGWAMIIAGALAAVVGRGIATFNNDADIREAKTLSALEEFSTNNGGRNLTEEEIKNIADEQDSSGQLAESLLEDINATNDMIEKMRANTAAIERNNDLIANQILQNNDYVAGSEHYNAIVDRTGDAWDNFYNKALDEIKKDGWGTKGIAQIDGANQQAKNIWKEYLQYAGLQDKGYTLVDTTGNDNNRIFVYLDEQGNRLEKTLTEMQKMKATYIADTKMNAMGNTLVGYFREWASKEGAADQAITSFLLGKNFEDATKSETSAMQQELNSEQYNRDIIAYLTDKLGDLDVAAEKLGYDGADKLVTAFTAAMSNIHTSWTDLEITGLSTTLQNSMDIATAQAFKNLMAQMNAGPLGEQAGIQFITGLNKILANMSADDAEEAMEKIAAIDWTKWNAAKDVVDIVEELGYQINMTEDELKTWTAQMNIANGAAFDHAQALEDISKISKLLENISIGQILTKDEYDLLVGYNEELAKYFRLLGNGTYKLTGDLLDFTQEVQDTINTAYEDAIIGARAEYNRVNFRETVDQRVENSGFTRDELSANLWGVTGSKGEWVADALTFGDVLEWLPNYVLSLGDAKLSQFQNYHYNSVPTDGIVDPEQYKAQIDFIDQYMSNYSGTQIQKWRDNLTEENAKEVSTIVGNYLNTYTEATADELKQAAEKVLSAEIDFAATATSQEQLDAMLSSGKIGLQAYNSAQLEFIQEEKWEGINADEVGKYADHLLEAAKNSELLFDNMNEEAAEDVALYTKKMNQGIEKLSGNIEDWSSILEESDSSSEEYAEAMSDMKDAMSDVLGVSENFLSDDFILENMEDIKKAAEGDAEAIDRLAIAASKNILINLNIQDENIRNKVMDLHDELVADIPDIQVGTTLTGTEEFLQKAKEIVATAGMTAEQANAYFRSMGFEVKFKTEEKDIQQRVPITYTKSSIVDAGWDPELGAPYWTTATSSWQDGFDTFTGKMDVMAMSTDGKTPQIESITKTNSGDMNNSSSSNPGGSSSSRGSKNKKPTKKSDIVERYKEINDKLADQEKVMDKASKAADRLWGPNRVQAMKDVNNALAENIDLLKDKRAEAEYNLKQDKQALKDAISKNANVTITNAMFDENGNFTSYNEVLNGLYNELHKAESDAGSEWNESEQKKIDDIQDRIDKVKEAISQYDETNTLIKDLDTEIQDAIYEWQNNNYEILNLELEYKVDINEKELEIVDYYLGKMEDDLYAYMEAMSQYNQQSTVYTDNLKNQEDYVNKLTEAYKDGEISEQAYKEGLASSQSAIISNLQSLEESKKAMQDYYGNVMAMAIEEIGIYTAEMEQLNSVLDHYSSIMDLVGKKNDYATKNKILTSKANNIRNELATQSELYEKSSAEAEYWSQKMSEAIVDSNEYETYKKNWQAAQQVANETQDAMLAKTQEWAEAMKAIVENELTDFATTMEEQLTGGISLDEMLTSMERRSSLQEEYLTTTNKIYETNKLMRTAQQEIDKTSNTVAKKRLQNFINETNELQNKTELSQYELEIQQAKYDLLLAEIALEEAQNAKSTVRLQRDSEGNFGYVYTADAAAVSDAEQKLVDAQNNLYNIGLEGANNYQQKYAETLQESQDAITELTQMWMNGEIESEEEFNRRKQEIVEYYGEKLKQYSELHSIALSADSRVVADAWSSDFTDMMATADEWQLAVDDYFKSAASSMETWASVCATALQDSKLNDVDSTLKNIDDKSKTLIITLLGEDGESGLVGAMMDQVDAAGKISESQTIIQDAIDETIGYFENLLIAINNAYTAMTTPVTPAISTEGGTYNPDGAYRTSGGTSPEGRSGYNNEGFDTATVKKAQNFVGVTADGKWGPQSQEAARKKGYNSLTAVVTAMNAGSSIGSPVKIQDNRNSTYIALYDTGGYTGEWGSYGKLAMLHEKELVLNKNDTENFLASMELLNRILQVLDLQTASSQLGGLLSTPTLGATNNGTLEQNIHIDAQFPNATDRFEIEEAFKSMVNLASQYANRK